MLEGNRGRVMDAEVRIKGADAGHAGIASSHTMHSIRPSSGGSSSSTDAPHHRRDRLIAATVEVLADGSVDRLDESRDTPKAL